MGSRTVCEHFHEENNCTECKKQPKIINIVILAKKGVTEEMQFICSSCNERINGGRILDGEYLYIVAHNPVEPEKSTFRCECCQDDHEDQEM
jgi:hypothetical protein